MTSGLAFAGACVSGAALGVLVMLRAASMRRATLRFLLWAAAIFGGFGAMLAWRLGVDALMPFLLFAGGGALVQGAAMARIAARLDQ